GANVGDDVVEFRVQHRLATAEGDDRRSQTRQVVDTALHGFHWNGLGEIVVLVAVGTREVAAASRDDVRQHGMVSRGHALGDHSPFPNPAFESHNAPVYPW